MLYKIRNYLDEKFFFRKGKIPFDGFCLVLTGADSEVFLQGQVVSNVKALEIGETQLSALISLQGRVESYFYLHKKEQEFWLIGESQFQSIVTERLEKYIIMEEVELKLREAPAFLLLNHPADIPCSMFQLEMSFSFQDVPDLEIISDLSLYQVFSAEPVWNKNLHEKMLLNETFLEERAVSYEKGCFLGQEVVAKVHNNRGAAFYPVLLEVNKQLPFLISQSFEVEGRKAGNFLQQVSYQGQTYLQVSLFRNFRVAGKSLEVKTGESSFQACVHLYPLQPENKAQYLYDRGLEVFAKEKESDAEKYLKRVLELNPELNDAYEALGVIYGRQERHQEALDLMYELQKRDESSVMAHTNASLYLMKLGKIEAAEEEKSKATLKSFAYFGTEAQLKKQEEQLKEEQKQESLRREKMFREVLELDSEDTLAHFGLGEIHLERGEAEQAVLHLTKVLEQDKQYSRAYLLLGKSLQRLNREGEAQVIYRQGVEVAAAKGDMMPANEMQSLLKT